MFEAYFKSCEELKFADEPKYDEFRSMMRVALKDAGADEQTPFQWEESSN